MERQTSYRDKVRGEYLHPSGVAAAQRLGIDATLVAAGGSWVTEAVGYDELIPPSHAPVIRIQEAASAAGVEVRRGVGDVSVSAGPSPRVRYELDDVEHAGRCRLVVGADGRASSVRRRLGLSLHGTESRTWGSRMLASGVDLVPVQRAALGTEDEIVASEPAGPCSKYPMSDTWTDEVAVPGVVLIGDAAGYEDAIIGEGLSIALRDARSVSETIMGGTDLSRRHFVPTPANERGE